MIKFTASSNDTTIEIGPQDVVIIFREDGSLEMAVPAQGDDDIVGDPTLLATCITSLLAEENKKLKKLIDRQLKKLTKEHTD